MIRLAVMFVLVMYTINAIKCQLVDTRYHVQKARHRLAPTTALKAYNRI